MELTDPEVLANRLVQRAWNRDGLPEIGVGLFSLLASGLIYATQVLPKRSPGFLAAILLLSFGLPILGFVLQPLIKRVRKQWLLDRYGHVEPLPTPKRNYLWGLALMAVMLPLAFLAFNHSERLLLPVTGLFGALLCGMIAWPMRLFRLMAGGVLMLATAVWLGLSAIPVQIAMAILFGSQGLYYMATGGIVFLRFMADER